MYNSKTSMKNSQGKEHCLICPPPSNSPTSPSLTSSLCRHPPPTLPPPFTAAGFLIIDQSLAQTTEGSKIRARCQGADLGKIRFHGGASSASHTTPTQPCLPFRVNIVLSFATSSLTPLFPFSFSLSPLSVSSCHLATGTLSTFLR